MFLLLLLFFCADSTSKGCFYCRKYITSFKSPNPSWPGTQFLSLPDKRLPRNLGTLGLPKASCILLLTLAMCRMTMTGSMVVHQKLRRIQLLSKKSTTSGYRRASKQLKQRVSYFLQLMLNSSRGSSRDTPEVAADNNDILLFVANTGMKALMQMEKATIDSYKG
ncbi:hypothetical protein L6452_09534 [Arctium lappa]|uniref:Uncharacterized protein n=1 Tax=Arctium lappa TaxID=4217 RepID=A0ACB9DKA3_ARCLA|nr:hypothetical protein L6452_09534 [Arctium lappa]